MKPFRILLILFVLPVISQAQVDTFQGRSHRNFPIIFTVQFENLALPFKDIRGNFQNLGLGLGTEVSLNGKNNWIQQVQAIWYRNKNMGNGIAVFTQPTWRPHFGSGFYGELKLGAGYLYSFRPSEAFRQEAGEWVSVGHRGKGMLMIPLGISIGYNKYSTGVYISPFASYQFAIVKGYNKSIPLVPQTFLQLGSRIHFNYK